MAYRFRKVGSGYLVWLQALNRYLKLEEPAFRVLNQFKEGLTPLEMIRECAERYQLPLKEAERFIGEIEEQFQRLYRNYQKPELASLPLNALPLPSPKPIERFIRVNGHRVRFSFGDPNVEQFIYPLFSHLEIPPGPKSYDLHIKVYFHNGSLYLIKNQDHAFKWEMAHAFKLKGALLLDVINVMHDATEESWMGVIHASSVCKGKQSVMFPAQPGAGKSTLAALMMAHGCQLVSDDFTPVAIENQEIYPFPGAISVKQGAMPLLKSYFPELESAPKVLNPSKGEKVSYLAPPELLHLKEGGYTVSAIVFVQYDEESDCELERVNSLEVINEFLNESWLAHKAQAAEQFMDWYLRTPCYKLRYGNHKKAVASIQKLF